MMRRRTLLAYLLALPAEARAVAPAAFRPEDFGARGDGRTDDTLAFQALGRAISERRGGTIMLAAGATYRVGRQARGTVAAGPAYLFQPMLRITGCTGVTIIGRGATLKLNDGLHYGSFDPGTGRRFDPPPGKFTDRRYAAAIGALIEIRSSRGVRLADLVLDGNVDQLAIGGRWEIDIQLAADGLQLIDVAEVEIANLVARNNGRDGVYLRGLGRAEHSPTDAIRCQRLRCDRNGRQGMSIVGGAGLSFTDCSFANTGQGPIDSAPGAGVDIEPNGRDWATGIRFAGCTFINNSGVGLVAAQGASRDITARQCTFWQGFPRALPVTRGSGDAFWLTKPGVQIGQCHVHGTVTNVVASAEISGCSFDDARHPIYGHAAQRRPYLIANASGTFTDCSFAILGAGKQGLVYATKPVTFRRCAMRHGGSGLTANMAVAFLGAAATLEDVTFAEAFPASSPTHYIYDGGAALKRRVIVTGPKIHWGSRTGPTGNIAALPRR